MAEYICRLGTPAGEIVTRAIEANGEREARARFEREGFRVFSIAVPKAAGASGVLPFALGGGGTRIKAGDFLLFNQQLAAIVRAGIPILQAITMLRRRTANERLQRVLADVEDRIRGGVALSDAFAAQGSVFPRIYTASILAGERSGALDGVLNRYVDYLRRSVELRRKLRGALAYPTFLFIACVAMVTFLTVFVVPRMAQLFEGFNTQLPAITVFVVGLSNLIASNFIWLGPLLLVSGGVFWWWARTAAGQLALDALFLKIPIVNQLIIQLATAQVTRSLATLLAGGIPLVEAWEIASESITNRELRRRSAAISPMIREGRSFTESLESAEWMPELGLDMIGVGERSGSLREMLEEVASFYDAEAEVRLEQLTTILEPAILVVMGGVVITILLAIYLPILQSVSNAATR
ncbi:MAG TPA: type II secretion system F family protein [Pyrinomonadaceae bacterium]|jgi:type IV pilus assembly protein PilC|nr:type II secretion system F family protein [Pyrinomonadaceae bacterium]